MTHNKAVFAVAGAEGPTSPMMQHAHRNCDQLHSFGLSILADIIHAGNPINLLRRIYTFCD